MADGTGRLWHLDAQVNNPLGIKNLLNASFLIEKSRESEFKEEVYKLDTKFEGKINFKYVGPLPPYSNVPDFSVLDFSVGLGSLWYRVILRGCGENVTFVYGVLGWRPRGDRDLMQYLDSGFYPVQAPHTLYTRWRGKLSPSMWP